MTTKTTYRAILQNIVCDRYESADAAFAAIETAFAAGNITDAESRTLARRVDPLAG